MWDIDFGKVMLMCGIIGIIIGVITLSFIHWLFLHLNILILWH